MAFSYAQKRQSIGVTIEIGHDLSLLYDEMPGKELASYKIHQFISHNEHLLAKRKTNSKLRWILKDVKSEMIPRLIEVMRRKNRFHLTIDRSREIIIFKLPAGLIPLKSQFDEYREMRRYKEEGVIGRIMYMFYLPHYYHSPNGGDVSPSGKLIIPDWFENIRIIGERYRWVVLYHIPELPTPILMLREQFELFQDAKSSAARTFKKIRNGPIVLRDTVIEAILDNLKEIKKL